LHASTTEREGRSEKERKRGMDGWMDGWREGGREGAERKRGVGGENRREQGLGQGRGSHKLRQVHVQGSKDVHGSKDGVMLGTT